MKWKNEMFFISEFHFRVTKKFLHFCFPFCDPRGVLFWNQWCDFFLWVLPPPARWSLLIAFFFIESHSLWSKELGIQVFLFILKDWALQSHGRYITRSFGGCSVLCESAEAGGGQGEWGLLAGFALCLTHAPGRGLTLRMATSGLLCTTVGAHSRHPSMLDVVTRYLKPAGAHESCLLFHGSWDVVSFSG